MAGNGQEGPSPPSSAKSPTLVLLDVNMPIMAGWKRSNDSSRSTRVRGRDAQLARTGQELEAALTLGAANYIRQGHAKEEITKALTETNRRVFRARIILPGQPENTPPPAPPPPSLQRAEVRYSLPDLLREITVRKRAAGHVLR